MIFSRALATTSGRGPKASTTSSSRASIRLYVVISKQKEIHEMYLKQVIKGFFLLDKWWGDKKKSFLKTVPCFFDVFLLLFCRTIAAFSSKKKIL